MSTEVSAKVWAESVQSGTRLLLLIALADYANAEGWCWPSIRSLCARTRMGERYVQKMLQEIQEDGEIQIKERPGHSNFFRVLVGVNSGSGVNGSSGVNSGSQRGESGFAKGVNPDAPRTVSRTKKNRKAVALDSVESIYQAYPRKVGKPKALSAISSVLKKGKITAEDLLAKTKQYGELIVKSKADMAYVPHPTTWFNQGRFLDEPEEWIRGARGNRDSKGNPVKETPKPRKSPFDLKWDATRKYLREGGTQGEKEYVLTFVQTLNPTGIPGYLNEELQSKLHELLAAENIIL